MSLGIGGWKKIKNKKVKPAPSYRYKAHKQLQNLSDDKLSDGAKLGPIDGWLFGLVLDDCFHHSIL